MGDQPERDARRDAWLAEQGIETLRIPAIEVLKDIDAAVDVIFDTAIHRRAAAAPSTALTGGPPPPHCVRGRKIPPRAPHRRDLR